MTSTQPVTPLPGLSPPVFTPRSSKRQERSASARSFCRKRLAQAAALLCSQLCTSGQPGFVFAAQSPGPRHGWCGHGLVTQGLTDVVSWSQELPGNWRCRRQHIQHRACRWLRSCCQHENIHLLHKSPAGPPKTDSLESSLADGLISPVPWFFETTQKITQRPACCQDTGIYYTPVQAEWKCSWVFSTQEDCKRSSQFAVCIVAELTDLRTEALPQP